MAIIRVLEILFYHLKKLLYQLYHIILQHTQHPIFYFPIQYIKIIYLYNKIYFSLLLKKKKKYIYIYISFLFSLSHFSLLLSQPLITTQNPDPWIQA